jgi:LmbE family N-acetylglucosaminyl deacetylase
MFVAAHPDDEAFAVAGTVALLAEEPRLRFVLVVATDGDAGEIAPDVALEIEAVAGQDPGARRRALALLRRQEDDAAWRAVGRVPDRVEWWGLPDGGLPARHGELVERIAQVLAEERPDVVATMGLDGNTGHPDHVTVAEAAAEAFHRVAAVGGDGMHRLAHAAIPQSTLDRWNRNRTREGLPPWDPDLMFHLRGVPDTEIGVRVDVDAMAPRIVAGIRAHRSQWSYAAVPADADHELARSLREECWVLGHPVRPAGAPVLRGLLDGLPDLGPAPAQCP